MRVPRLAFVMVSLVACFAFTPPSRTRACGGCFAPPAPMGSAAVVTAHRMVFSIGPTQTTLWDQFSYAGAPEDFVWALPASPDARVELADNRFFERLEQPTNVSLTGSFPPLAGCPGCPCVGCRDSAVPPSDSSPSDGGVVVHAESTVGPYETVTVSSDDPMALLAWLQGRGYAVPDALLPTIRYYGEMGMAFVVLRLSPGEGVQRMQPVRVTVLGTHLVLPLRMIAAGVADKVDLRLFVFGEGRYEASNYPNDVVTDDEVAYDWSTGAFDYDTVFRDALASSGGRTWVTTYSGSSPIRLGDSFFGEDGDGGFGSYSVDDDLSVALEGLTEPIVTRMESSLAVGALDRDLILGLAADESRVSQFLVITRERNRPPPPVCPPLECASGDASTPASDGSVPRMDGGRAMDAASADAARRRVDGNGCSAAAPRSSTCSRVVLGAIAFGLWLVARRRRRGATDR